MPVVPRAQTRRTETPNAVMTTLASPTLGGAHQSVWRVEMRPASAGPRHTLDVEQVWTVLDGGATIELAGESLRLDPGDTLVVPAAVPRQITADHAAGLEALVTSPAGARAATPDGRDHGVPPWIA